MTGSVASDAWTLFRCKDCGMLTWTILLAGTLAPCERSTTAVDVTRLWGQVGYARCGGKLVLCGPEEIAPFDAAFRMVGWPAVWSMISDDDRKVQGA